MNVFPHPNYTLRIGYHVSKLPTLTDTIRYAMSLPITAMQIFLRSPKSWATTSIDVKDLLVAGRLLREFPSLWMCVHAAYIYSLHGVMDPNSRSYETNYELTINSAKIDLDICACLGCGMVLHPGSAKRTDSSFKRMTAAIHRILTDDSKITSKIAAAMGIDSDTLKKRRCLYLENCVGEGSKIGTIPDLRKLYEMTPNSVRTQLSFCIDTCHLFASGEYDLRTNLVTFFESLDIPLSVIHLNDSQQKFGSKKDRHENLCVGKIWNRSSLAEIVKYCNTERIPMIIETANGDKDVSLVNSIPIR